MPRPDPAGWTIPRAGLPGAMPVAIRPAAGAPALAAVVLLGLAAWAALVAQAWRAGGDAPFLSALCQPAAGAASPGLAAFLRDAAGTSALWALMSVAMMLPTAVPMLASYQEACRRSSRPLPSAAYVAAGYLAIWLGVSVLAAVVQTAGLRIAAGWTLPGPLGTLLAGGLVGAAGLYQFSPLKLRCLAFCRHDIPPADLTPSVLGTVRLGLRQGLGCLGCCGPMMALMLLAGVANLFWMAGFALLMTVEKLVEGLWATRLIGVMLFCAGFAVAASPVGLAPVLGAFRRLIAGGTP